MHGPLDVGDLLVWLWSGYPSGMSGMLDQLLAEYEAAARRIAALHRRWERMALSDPLERGQDAWHMRQGQLDLEDQIRKLWDEYIEKRNAYLAAVGRPKQ
jgi:hypothetical protein